LRLVKCLESWCYQKNLHGLGLSNVNKKWKIFSNCVAFWQYMNFMWLCSGPDLPEWNALKDQSIYIPMTMPVLLNKVIQWHCIQKIENESPLFQPQTEDYLLHSKQSPYSTGHRGPLLTRICETLEKQPFKQKTA
jgi:hypothetical protein